MSALVTENVLFMRHARARMKQRHITLTVVYEVLQRGVLAMPPEPDPRYPGVRCRMRRYVAGMNVDVVVYVDHPEPDLVVVTVIDVGGTN